MQTNCVQRVAQVGLRGVLSNCNNERSQILIGSLHSSGMLYFGPSACYRGQHL